MTALEKLKAWLATYPQFNVLDAFNVDYTDAIPANGGIFPTGLIEEARQTDILGGVTLHNRYNFGLYYVFEKASGDDVGAQANAEWVADFQSWVQEQSAKGLAPAFGDEPRKEVITAQDGVLYDAGEGLATYMVQLTITFIKKY